ncbi:MAG: glycosyltransferase [Flavobacteriales bacterium]|nr:glycosyltransferase [Flavobacteriales bacterium]
MILYLTYNDQPSGVYWGQVTDVVDHLNTLGEDRVRLVALVSLRGYLRSFREIRKRRPRSWVLPMVPRAHNWRINWIWLWLACRWLKPSGIIGRGIFATALALRMRDRGLVAQVCFDGRAAYGAEWEEYRVVDNDRLIAECVALEREVVQHADLRMAVSEALVHHWREFLGYRGERHRVIPCTLGRSVEAEPARTTREVRAALGWNEADTILVYSGTSVGWQSLELAETAVGPWLEQDASHRMLFLSQEHAVIDRLKGRFPGQVQRRWVPHQDVRALLQACDHGLLLREPRITNRVASPTKFAEYLSAGLPVLISEGVGDFSDRVRGSELGQVYKADEPLRLLKPSAELRDRLMRLAREEFTKEAFNAPYRTVLGCMCEEPGTESARPFMTPADGAPLVSIIVPSFNKRGFIGDMVATVQAQTEAHWELRIVDDASSDGSPELLASLAASDARIRLIALSANMGANHCRNLGIQEARGRYIIFLDADDLFAAQCVERRLAVMAGSGLDLSVSTMEVFKETPGDHGQLWVPLSRSPLTDFFRHKLPWQTMQPIWDRDFLRALHGFDSSFSRHQDVELHTRALLVPGVRLRMRRTQPDCYYRIAEERKVLDPRKLLMSFSDSAVKYRSKFLADARRMGRPNLLLGIIHRTYLQILLNAKAGRIDRASLRSLEEVLLAAEWTAELPEFKRWLFLFTRWYNLLPLRVPGVNMLVFALLTSGRKRAD